MALPESDQIEVSEKRVEPGSITHTPSDSLAPSANGVPDAVPADVSSGNTAVDGTSSENTVVDDTSPDNTVVDDTSSGNTAVNDTSSDDTAVDDTSSNNTVIEDTFSDEDSSSDHATIGSPPPPSVPLHGPNDDDNGNGQMQGGEEKNDYINSQIQAGDSSDHANNEIQDGGGSNSQVKSQIQDGEGSNSQANSPIQDGEGGNGHANSQIQDGKGRNNQATTSDGHRGRTTTPALSGWTPTVIFQDMTVEREEEIERWLRRIEDSAKGKPLRFACRAKNPGTRAQRISLKMGSMRA
ncbi:uncharacterized protein C8A04DRAFT_26575 [Dichotomopilus funicola]|uniref:Uncharacterized protein n=1 Tax=Dichotomopilus funicola TaxID=1934379 RepID=A0AAN6V6A4_9PEZI|nr:hypothetical protein C8A04DRAFT_26575 [Dichotomopilus funicola]